MHASVESQTAAAFSEDLGITSSRFPYANCPGAQSACLAAPNGGSPELNATRLKVTVAYMRLLGVPARRGGDTTEVLQGKALFASVGCASCHRPSFRTRADAAEPELAGQLVWPYTDLLLHDLGERLADHRKEGDAGPREWRTPPLWGLGLVPVVNGTRFLLHDGRARDLDEAILWHDGGRGVEARVRAASTSSRRGSARSSSRSDPRGSMNVGAAALDVAPRRPHHGCRSPAGARSRAGRRPRRRSS